MTFATSGASLPLPLRRRPQGSPDCLTAASTITWSARDRNLRAGRRRLHLHGGRRLEAAPRNPAGFCAAIAVVGPPSGLSKPTPPETSQFAPAIAEFNAKMYIAWTEAQSVHRLDIESSSDGVNFGNKVTLPETSRKDSLTFGVDPALASSNGRLFIAWEGTDNRLDLESSSNGVNFGNKVTLPETSNAAALSTFKPGPALTSLLGCLYIAWKGTDKHLNSESSSNGVDFGNKVTYAVRPTEAGPELAIIGYSRIEMAWTGTNGDHHLESIVGDFGA